MGVPEPRFPSPLALFRLMVVSVVQARCLAGEPRAVVVTEVAGSPHLTPAGKPRKICERTLYRWLADYALGGVAALEPAGRPHTDSSVVLPEDFLAFLRQEKGVDPRASVPEVVRRATEQGLLQCQQEVHRVSVWRACRRLALPTRRRPHKREADTRRFAYPHRMMMVLVDGKHFRAGIYRAKRVAFVFLDDATRYALDGIVGPSESAELFLHGLYGALGEAGYFDILFADHGDGFIADDTRGVVANLPHAHLIHGAVRYPEGHGKIEVFNRSLFANLLRGFDRAADVDPACGALTVRLRHYLKRVYNLLPHEALGGDTPLQRWERDCRALRLPADEAALRRAFVIQEGRTVSADHVIRHGGQLYEAPKGLAGTRVEVHRNVLDGQLSVLHEGRMVRLHPVDLAANATDPRHRPGQTEEPPSTEDVAPPRTAAMMAFDREFGPLVDRDGGFTLDDELDPDHSDVEKG